MRICAFLLLLLPSLVYANDGGLAPPKPELGHRAQFDVESKSTTVVGGVVSKKKTILSYTEKVIEARDNYAISVRDYSRFAEGVFDAKVKWQVVISRGQTRATHRVVEDDLHPSAQRLLVWELALPQDATRYVLPDEPKALHQEWPIPS